MDITLEIGERYTSGQVVRQEDTAVHYGSGLIEVFATPAMVALMENAAMHVALKGLPYGYNTVGVEVAVQHTRATPKGMNVSATAILTRIDGRRLVFEVTAGDEKGEIGRGTHIRYIIDTVKFMEKVNA